MRTKTAPRRAMANAAIMAVLPIDVLLSGMNSFSEHIFDQLLEKSTISLEQKVDLHRPFNQTVQDSNWIAFYWVWITSILINWPIPRWMVDRQLYREWIRKKEEE